MVVTGQDSLDQMTGKDPTGRSLADLVRDIYGSFSRGDLTAMQRTGSSDIVLHIPGKSSVAGTHRGIGDVIAVAARAMARFVPTSLEVLSVEAEGKEAAARIDLTGRTPDGTTATVRMGQRFRFDEQDRVAETWVEPEDQRQFDRLLG